MDQPQPYIFDGIYYENKKRVRTPSPIFKNYQQNKKIKKDSVINEHYLRPII